MPPLTLTVERARGLRRAMTPPERRLWAILRGKALAGFRFRRQHPTGPYSLNSFCPAVRLAIEVDGEGHGHPDQAEHDVRRDRWLTEQGVRTLRIAAIDNLRNPVLQNIGGPTARIVLAPLDKMVTICNLPDRDTDIPHP